MLKKTLVIAGCVFGVWYIYQIARTKVAYRNFKKRMAHHR